MIFYQDLDTSLFLDESAGIQLANSTLVAKKVQFDAFRTKDRAPPGFRVSNVFISWKKNSWRFKVGLSSKNF